MEVQSRMSLPETANEEDRVTMNETSLIESHDSTSKCEGEPKPGPVDMEERSFVSSLYGFMKNKGTPIERIPHLGFKQINLWRIFKAVEKLGGYDLVTASRLWKNVYDELGGSPGSTSAATCTRRHYERLVLPFERHLRGEEDKPLPPSKPRKQYKRNNDGRVSKTEGKRKRTQSEREMDFEGEERPEAGSQSETRTHSLSTPWTITSDRAHPGSSQPNRGVDDLSPGLTYPHLLQVPALCPWGGPVSSAGEVISPLEKKKRMAQASLSLPLSPGHSEGKDRPSVIHCSQSPGMTPPRQNGNSSDGSPRPLSSSCSSRSPSPYSISSEDCAAPDQDKPASADLPPSGSSSFTHISGSCEGTKSLSSSPKTKDLVGPHKDIPHISPHRPDIDSEKRWSKDSVWIPVHKENGRYLAPQWPLSLAFTAKSDWMPASNSSFTKVVRPIPFQPTYRLNQRRSLQPDEALACEKKLHSMAPWLHPTEKKRCRTTLPKPLPTQQPLPHSTATLPPSYLLTGYDRSGRDSRHQPQPHPPFVTTRIRLPHEQPAYRHIPMGPTHSNFYGSAMYSYPYPVTLCNPQAGFSLTGMTSIYPQKH